MEFSKLPLKWTLAFLISWSFQSCTSPSNNPVGQTPVKGVDVKAKKGVTGTLVDQKRKPVPNSMVEALLGGDDNASSSSNNSARVVDSVTTDDQGRYAFDSLPPGTYNLNGNFQNGSLVVLIRNIKYDGGDSLVEVPTDTLRTPGKISGRAMLLEEYNGGTTCYIPGTSYLALTDDSGAFVISNVPQGLYTVAYMKVSLKPAKDTAIQVVSGENTKLPTKKMEADPAYPPPAPGSLSVMYDTLTGRATVKWKPVSVSDLAGYVVYRNLASGTIPERVSPVLLTDTVFVDTLFKNRFDTLNLDLMYQVKSQDKDANLSSVFSKAITLSAPSPMKVRTAIGWTLLGVKGDSATVGDTILVIAGYSNPSHKITKVLWFLDDDTVPLRTTNMVSQKANDSLKIVSEKVATRTIYTEAIDETGVSWRNGYPVRFVQDVPSASPGSSSFRTSLSVTLSTPTADAKIYYTLDGTTPDTNSALYNPANPLLISVTTTLKAISFRQGWQKPQVMSAVYTKNFVASTLDILDQNGNPLIGGYLSEKNASFTVKVTTTQAGLASLSPIATTNVGIDSESLTLHSHSIHNGISEFTGTIPFLISSSIHGNNKIEAAAYDSLTIRWFNPFDSKDVAERRILINPAPIQGRSYFSTKPDGTDIVDQYMGTESTLYLFVLDEAFPSGLKATVSLETTPKSGSGRTKDTETIDLTMVSAGKYRATIPLDINPTSVPNDKKIQLTLQDLIKATYIDPIYSEAPVVSSAGFGISPEIGGSVQFTDKNGNILPLGTYYSPAEGQLYLSYRDDFVNGSIPTKKVTLTIDNGKAKADTETFNLSLNLAKHSGSIGVWEGSINLNDAPTITPKNNIAETHILGKIHAVVSSHDKTGAGSTPVFNDLLVAYPNQDADISVVGSKDSGVSISGKDTTVKIIITDQNLSSGIDTLYATLSCSESKDVLVNVMLVEKVDVPGTYVSSIISKSEGAAIVDGALQCHPHDFIKVSYVDPVYGNSKVIVVPVDDPVVPTSLYFSPSAKDSTHVAAVQEKDATSFYATVVASDPRDGVVDTIPVTFTSSQGETETFKAIETGPSTGVFGVNVPFSFTTSAATPNNGKVEGVITFNPTISGVTLTGSVPINGMETKSDITLIVSPR